MSAVRESVRGVRQQVTAVMALRLLEAPDWAEGPFPFRLGSGRTDVRTRSTYFTPASSRVLYGTPEHPCRWHRPGGIEFNGLVLDGIELLRTTAEAERQNAIGVAHFTVDTPLLPVLRAFGGRPGAGPSPLSGPLSVEALFGTTAEVRMPASPVYTVALLTPGPANGDALRARPSALLPGSADTWLWQLASRSTPDDFPPAPESLPHELDRAVRISADWSALVLRHGAAFLGHRADTGSGDFFDFAAMHARSVYLDALLLGTLQREYIDELTDELSAVFSQPHLASRVGALERNIARFRSTHWRQHLTAHGPANDLLLALQGQHGLPERFAEILAEAADYGRLVQNQESQQISGALGVLTVLGLPLGTALSVLQVLGDQSVAHLLVALALSVLATAGALTTRYGRLVLSSLRGAKDTGAS